MGFLRNLFDAEYGLVRANLKAYHLARDAGEDHQSAVGRMIGSRYAAVAGGMDRIVMGQAVEILSTVISRKEQLRDIVWSMLMAEMKGSASISAFESNFEEVWAEMQKKYPRVVV